MVQNNVSKWQWFFFKLFFYYLTAIQFYTKTLGVVLFNLFKYTDDNDPIWKQNIFCYSTELWQGYKGAPATVTASFK